MSTLSEMILNKLGLGNESLIQSKTTELLRLLELRSSNLPTHLSDYGKIVLCADIAASLLSLELDKEAAFKLSGLRKSQYANTRRLVEKLLDLNRLVSTKDICIQLGLSGLIPKAEELLALYEKIVACEDTDVDIKHPQYAAMAVYQASKMLKQKVSKPKIMSFSHLRPTQWVMLEQRWNKLLDEYYKPMQEKNMKNETTHDAAESVGKNEKIAEKRKKHNEIENYEHWRQRILEAAKAKLQISEAAMEDKENI